MLGAIIGDMVGAPYEFQQHNIKSKEFPLFSSKSRFTDDTVTTLAVCLALLDAGTDYAALSEKAVYHLQTLGQKYCDAGYGARFYRWLWAKNPEPYGSYGNGSAMRVSGVGHLAKSLAEARSLARAVTAITHNHAEGLKGAVATAEGVYLARNGSTMAELRSALAAYYPELNDPRFTLDNIRPAYRMNMACQASVPQAFAAFLESTSFEDALRGAVSIGGDSDTIAAIAGSIAGPFWGIPTDIAAEAASYLPEEFVQIIAEFEARTADHNKCN